MARADECAAGAVRSGAIAARRAPCRSRDPSPGIPGSATAGGGPLPGGPCEDSWAQSLHSEPLRLARRDSSLKPHLEVAGNGPAPGRPCTSCRRRIMIAARPARPAPPARQGRSALAPTRARLRRARFCTPHRDRALCHDRRPWHVARALRVRAKGTLSHATGSAVLMMIPDSSSSLRLKLLLLPLLLMFTVKLVCVCSSCQKSNNCLFCPKMVASPPAFDNTIVTPPPPTPAALVPG